MVPACNSHDKKNGYQEMRTVQGIPEAEEKTEENLNTEGNNNQEQTNSSNEEESNQNQQENKTEEVTEISKTGYVKADGLYIRKEPTTSSEAIHSLSFNSKVKITGEIDGWYRINYNDQIGYVSQKYVSDTKEQKQQKEEKKKKEQKETKKKHTTGIAIGVAAVVIFALLVVFMRKRM